MMVTAGLLLVAAAVGSPLAHGQPSEPTEPPASSTEPAEPAATASSAAPTEPVTESSTAADQAFRAGMKLMEAGRYAEACQRLETSLELDDGMATRFRLGECYERIGRTASAWRIFADVAAAAHAVGMTERAGFARGRAAGLEPRLTRLLVTVPAEVAAVSGVQIHLDGDLLTQASWGRPLPVDPGAYEVQATAPGHPAWRRSIDARGEGKTVTLSVPPWSKTGGSQVEVDDGIPAQTIAGIVLAASGVVAAGIGVGVGIAASNRYDESAAHCIDDYCHPEGLAIRDEAINQADIATLVVAIGGVAAVGGIVLWWTSSDSDDDEPLADADAEAVAVRLGPAGLSLEGTW